MKFAIIENNIVINVAVADAPLADNWLASEVAAIGDIYKDGIFIKPPPVEQDIEQLKLDKWNDIKQYRDRLTQTGGYKAQDKWFHSDTFSRSQQLGLVIMGNSIPANLYWKTMDGSFILMSPALAQEIFQSAAIQDSLIFYHAESLNSQVQALQDTQAVQQFDITQGWPETFQDTQA